MMRLLLLLTCFSLGSFSLAAQEERLTDPAQEELARDIMKGIRCLVCQNQSVDESDADLARDIRQIIREQVAAGNNADQVEAFLVDRYGEWVLLNPPFQVRTALLWLAPLLFMVLGVTGIFFFIRNRRRDETLVPLPLSLDERTKLQGLLKDEPE